ncbi:MAG: hypothetical protein WCR42_03190 [bacterium]
MKKVILLIICVAITVSSCTVQKTVIDHKFDCKKTEQEAVKKIYEIMLSEGLMYSDEKQTSLGFTIYNYSSMTYYDPSMVYSIVWQIYFDPAGQEIRAIPYIKSGLLLTVIGDDDYIYVRFPAYKNVRKKLEDYCSCTAVVRIIMPKI